MINNYFSSIQTVAYIAKKRRYVMNSVSVQYLTSQSKFCLLENVFNLEIRLIHVHYRCQSSHAVLTAVIFMMCCQNQYFIKVFQKRILFVRIDLKYKPCMIHIHKYINQRIGKIKHKRHLAVWQQYQTMRLNHSLNWKSNKNKL